MGRQTKNFRQTNKAGRADTANKNYARVNRSGGWNPFKLFKKEKIDGTY